MALLGLLPTAIFVLVLAQRSQGISRPISNSFGTPFINATYDYVVVGGGNAGLTIASRLAEDFSVAVVEAGGFYEIDNGNGSVIPGLAGGQFVNTAPGIKQPLIDWEFVTVPQDGAGGRRIRYARGKTLGGCTARNYMAYQRPTKESLRKWADEVGDDSYTWENLLPYYKKTATIRKPDYGKRQKNGTVAAHVDAFDNAQDGPLPIGWPNYAEPIGTWFELAFKRAGIGERKDGFSNGALLGHGWPTAALNGETGTRETSYTSYLRRAMKTSAIKVYHRTMAKRILFDENKRANGVLVETAGIDYTLFAAKEVILSAGTFQSPQLLMVSGIGPRDTLAKFDITVLKDAQGVGQNLQDHPFITTNWRVAFDTISRFFRDPAYLYQANADFLDTASGPLSSPFSNWAWEKAGPEFDLAAATVDALGKEFDSTWPNIEYIPISAYVGDYTGKQIDLFDGTNSASLFAVLISSLSRGTVSISSASALDPPVIDPRWLTHPADKDLMIQAFKRMRQIVEAIPEAIVGEETWPGPQVQSDEEIYDAIQQGLGMVYHASSTCKMGRADDEMAVVDTRGRVYGVEGLRVVDASIMPFLPPGHPMATVYMLAEKIADDIKKSSGSDRKIGREAEARLESRDEAHWILEAPHDEL